MLAYSCFPCYSWLKGMPYIRFLQQRLGNEWFFFGELPVYSGKWMRVATRKRRCGLMKNNFTKKSKHLY